LLFALPSEVVTHFSPGLPRLCFFSDTNRIGYRQRVLVQLPELRHGSQRPLRIQMLFVTPNAALASFCRPPAHDAAKQALTIEGIG
jgi:hypothetical protein